MEMLPAGEFESSLSTGLPGVLVGQQYLYGNVIVRCPSGELTEFDWRAAIHRWVRGWGCCYSTPFD